MFIMWTTSHIMNGHYVDHGANTSWKVSSDEQPCALWMVTMLTDIARTSSHLWTVKMFIMARTSWHFMDGQNVHKEPGMTFNERSSCSLWHVFRSRVQLLYKTAWRTGFNIIWSGLTLYERSHLYFSRAKGRGLDPQKIGQVYPLHIWIHICVCCPMFIVM